MVDIEISGVLEERLRRLVELGVYSSISEAVRDAVRRLLDQLDLKELAFKLYVSSDASFQYVSEFADTSFDEMIEYMVSKGFVPLIGIESTGDLTTLKEDKKYVLDPLTIYVIYKSELFKYFAKLPREGYEFLIPDSVKSWVEVLVARRLFHAFEYKGLIKFFETTGLKAPSLKTRLTRHEQYAINYVKKNNDCILLTEDIRTRKYARSRGVKAYSSISILYTLKDNIDNDSIADVLFSLKSIPLIIPASIMEVFGIAI
ncbi:MAG: hypothetical protein DRO40_08800 [Thermoprotei archaeon]|nr:MAG: hypothetical protein DRO40_08800 [Thermoprotei archaeon]